MKFQPKKSASPAEQRLAEAEAAQAAAQAEVDAAQAVLSRLEDAARAPGPIHAELQMLDRDESAAMAQWAADPNAGAAPTPDADRRSDLLKRLAAAEAQARAAAGAMGAPRAAVQAASQRLGAAHRQSWIAGKLLQIEEADEKLPALKAAIASIYSAKRAVDFARAAILTELQPGEDTSEVFHALQAFDLRRMEAESIPTTEIRPPYDLPVAAADDVAAALAALGNVSSTAWGVSGAPSQAAVSARVGLFAR